jgi:hypothetical protein
MKAITLFVIGFALSLPGLARAQKDDLKKQIVGKWEATLKDGTGMEYTINIEFKDGGKAQGTARGLPFTGSYRFTKDDELELETTAKDGVTKKTTQTIKITQDMMEWKDATGLFRFKRAK